MSQEGLTRGERGIMSHFELLVIPFFHVWSQEFVTNAVLRKAGGFGSVFPRDALMVT